MGIKKCSMETMAVNKIFWSGRRVFVTGHTGFKGGWLTLWLAEMGAKVYGYALPPPTHPSFYEVTNLKDVLEGETIADIRNSQLLETAIFNAKPEIVFHLAAQPLVRYSYTQPVETFEVNVMGTVNLLEATRKVETVRSIVNVTTDKCYENKELCLPFKESDKLGGNDPYSSSKACSELISESYRNSFLKPLQILVQNILHKT